MSDKTLEPAEPDTCSSCQWFRPRARSNGSEGECLFGAPGHPGPPVVSAYFWCGQHSYRKYVCTVCKAEMTEAHASGEALAYFRRGVCPVCVEDSARARLRRAERQGQLDLTRLDEAER